MPPTSDHDDAMRPPEGPDVDGPEDGETGPTHDAGTRDSLEWDDDLTSVFPTNRDAWDPGCLVGTAIAGRFEILEKIGEGGFSYVFRARQLSVGRDVAIKLPLSRDDTASANRLRRGSRLQGRLDHRFVARILDAGTAMVEDAELPWVAMDLVAGGRPLTEFCRERGLDLPARLALFADVCEGVGSAHAKDIVHRDLKPANILVNTDGEPRVIDFDIAWDPDVLNETIAKTMNASAALPERIIGTLHYMSPEHRAGKRVDARSDVYALGITLQELCGDPEPPPGETVVGTTRRQQDAAVAVGLGGPCDTALPPGIERLLDGCLHRVPDRRYVDANVLADAVRQCLSTGDWAWPDPPVTATMDEGSDPQNVVGAQNLASARLSWNPRQAFARLAATIPARLLRRVAIVALVFAAVLGAAVGGLRERFRASAYANAVGDASRGFADDGRKPEDALPLVDVAVECWRAWRGATPLPLELVCMRGMAGITAVSLDDVPVLAMSASGRWQVSGAAGGKVDVRDVARKPELVYHRSGLAGDVASIAFDRGDTLAVAGSQGGCRIWNLKTIDRNSWPVRVDADGAAGVIDISPDGSRLALVMASGAVEIRETVTSGTVCVVPASSGATPTSPPVVSFNATGTRLFIAPGDGSLRVIDVSTGSESERVAGLPFGPLMLCRSADGSRLAVFVTGGRLRLHDSLTGRPLTEAGSEPSDCRHAAFGPDGRTLVVVRSDAESSRRSGVVEIFDTSRQGQLRSEAALPMREPISGLALGGRSRIAVRMGNAWRIWSDDAAVPRSDASIARGRQGSPNAAVTGS